MYKLIIVDDEFWARDTIKAFIRWEELGLELAGEAGNGWEAAELMEKLNPDIVITDMKMPGVDGVSFLKMLQLAYTNTRIIVVSGYGDFEYTKQAIKAKVFEYILKPVDQEELHAALQKCIGSLCKENGNSTAASHDRTPSGNQELMKVLLPYKSLVRTYLAERKGMEIKKALECCFDEVRKMNPLGDRELRKIISEFVSILEEYFVENGYDDRDTIRRVEEFTYSAEAVPAMDEVRERLVNLFDVVVITITDKLKRNSKGVVYDIKEYIDRNYSADTSLARLAGQFFISKEYLSKAFKNEFGCNLTDYVAELRMSKAKEMICTTRLTLKNIARAVGYDDIPYFYRVFRNCFGIPPGQLRDEKEKKG